VIAPGGDVRPLHAVERWAEPGVDGPMGERLAFLTVEHMDGLRVDRVALRVSEVAQEGLS